MLVKVEESGDDCRELLAKLDGDVLRLGHGDGCGCCGDAKDKQTDEGD